MLSIHIPNRDIFFDSISGRPVNSKFVHQCMCGHKEFGPTKSFMRYSNSYVLLCLYCSLFAPFVVIGQYVLLSSSWFWKKKHLCYMFLCSTVFAGSIRVMISAMFAHIPFRTFLTDIYYSRFPLTTRSYSALLHIEHLNSHWLCAWICGTFEAHAESIRRWKTLTNWHNVPQLLLHALLVFFGNWIDRIRHAYHEINK